MGEMIQQLRALADLQEDPNSPTRRLTKEPKVTRVEGEKWAALASPSVMQVLAPRQPRPSHMTGSSVAGALWGSATYFSLISVCKHLCGPLSLSLHMVKMSRITYPDSAWSPVGNT